MENIKKYAYILDQTEIREFAFHAMLEQVKYHKGRWFRLLVILVLELILLPRVAGWMAVLIAALLLVAAVRTYGGIRKSLSGQQWTVWLEGGLLKSERGGASEMPCASLRLFRTTRRLLMLGYLQTPQRPAWFVIPLRAFVNAQERECFLEQVRNPQAAAEPKEMVSEEGKEGIRFTYMLDETKWIHFHKSAGGILSSGTLDRAERVRTVLLWSICTVILLFSFVYLVEGRIDWQWGMYALGIAALMIVRILFRDPERALKKQIRLPAVRDRECGEWKVTLSETGVVTRLSTGVGNTYTWEMVGWLVETEDAFYFFHKDKRHYVLITKESFQEWNQVSVMRELSARKGVKHVQARKAHYLPDWAFVLTAVLFAILCIVTMFVNSFWNHVQETREQLQGILQEASEISLQEESEPEGYLDQEPRETLWQEESEPTDYPDQEPREISWQDDFDPADYPDYVPLDEQVEVLESFGFEVPEEVVESVRDSMAVYGLQVSIEGYPYTWILTNLGAPQYNEDWTAIEEYSRDVFWFDFEGWDYIDVLNGMLALAEDSCLDTVTNISEDDSRVNWEQGKGTITVSLEWDGQTYQWDMDVHYDWIDSDVLGILNALLTEGKSQKFFYVTGDNGQGAIVFFCTAEWAEKFGKATGLELEHYSVWSEDQEEQANTP